MTLTLVTGRAIAGKTGVLHAAVIDAIQAGRRAVVLVPSYADVRRTRAELSRRAPVGVDVSTLDAWAEGLWALHGDGRRIVGESARRMLMGEVVSSNEANPLASMRGYRDLAVVLAARTAGAELPAAVRPSQALMLADVASYRRTCADKGLVERGEALHLLGAAGSLGDAVIAVNRFTDLAPSQLAFIQALAEHNDVVLALSWEDGAPATDALTSVVHMILDTGAEHVHLSTPPPTTELGAVERYLFAPGMPLVPSGAVQFMTAAGEEAEAALVARAVGRAVAEGVPPDEIAVAFRDVASRTFLIAAALAAEGVECELDVTVALERSPLGRALSALLSAIDREGGREALLSFLLSPYSGASAEAVEEFDSWARTNRVQDTGRLLKRARALGDETEQVFAAGRAVCGARLDDEGARAWKRLVDLMVDNGLRRPGRSDIEVRLDGAGHRVIIDAAGELAATSRGRAPARDLIEHVASSPTHSGGEEREGAVYVTEAHRLRSRRFRVVVIGGLTADEFSSEKREPLAARILGELRMPAGTEERLSERLLFYSVATRARERLVLVRRSSSSTGTALRASAFWDEVMDLYRSAEQAEEGVDAIVPVDTLPLSRLEQAAPAITKDRRALRHAISASGEEAAEARRGEIRETPWSDPEREFSVTEIETYVGCPYRWFYDRILRPRELDGAFGGRERGALVHAVLAEFYRRFTREVAPRVEPTMLAKAHTLFEAVWEHVAPAYELTTRGLSEQLDLSRAHEMARDAIIQDALLLEGYCPIGQEWRFGAAAERPFAFGGVRLRGSIDRLESNGSLLVVTDYKSSSAKGHRSWAAEGLLQVVVYGEAAGRILGQSVAGGFYRNLATGEIRGFWNVDRAEPEDWVARNDRVTEAEYHELVTAAEADVRSSADGIARASIAPRPRRGSVCEYCGAKSFCEEARA